MSIQDKITKAVSPSLRKIFDYKVSASGTESQVVRLKVARNQYQDITDIDVVSHDTVVIKFPNLTELPLTRLRTELTNAPTTTTSLFLYDLLPITAIAQFQDNIEWNDILIRKLYSDLPSTPQMYLVLQVTEVFGTFSNNFLLWRQFNCAPYNEALPVEVQTIVDSYTLPS